MSTKMLTVLAATTWLGFLAGCAPALIVAAGTGAALVAHDRRTAGTMVDDETIEIKIASGVRGDPQLREKAHINATSFNNAVLLTGEAPTQTLRDEAAALARKVPKVRVVHNEIRLAAPSSLASRSRDSVITGRVKTAMLEIKLKDFDPTRVKVVTENGVVYVMGLVRRDEAQAVVAVTRKTGGVRKVVKVFEYIE
jgi:osmotically-inducible protein OsmY